ncbi:MAG: hypothetical protein AB7D06_15990 [Pedobacter sp.]
MNTSVKTLIGFLLLLAVALVYAYFSWPRQTRVASVPAPGISTGISVKPDASPPAGEVLPKNQVPEERETLVNRNIFSPLFSLPAQASLPEIQESQTESAPLPPVVLPPPTPTPVFLGKLRHAGRQKVFLSVEGEVYVVGPGDSFGADNTYRLLEIASQYLIVKYKEDKDTFQIETAEQPISLISSSGASYVEVMQPVEPTEINVPIEPGSLDKEVPIDNVIDE